MKAFEENPEKSFPGRERVYQSQCTTHEVGSDQKWIVIDWGGGSEFSDLLADAKNDLAHVTIRNIHIFILPYLVIFLKDSS